VKIEIFMGTHLFGSPWCKIFGNL